jgi:DNA-binding protein H-NS
MRESRSVFKLPPNFASRDRQMKNQDLNSMTVDQLWELYELVTALLSDKVEAEKAILEDRLRKLGSMAAKEERAKRRPYPKVQPKYRNPKGGETWAGRGKQPRWLTAQLKNGKKLNDFLILA